ncbi:flagellar biosynthesis protein FliO [Tepidamorphus gemmatus]|uniref:Flagellar biosynthesis protein FliO n=1 Tax=Tepidamorphus gemmatus TaxID=747076 RepID=A0A4R3MI51_9HYPH|nr:flagellar biosynthetic protein FliO [Tepidamorphus gemmatus]TCT13541.1 flagellar biosynthesis protein FliO [Tepidamorphus gemmatus]
MEWLEGMLGVTLNTSAKFIIAFVFVLLLISFTAWVIRTVAGGRIAFRGGLRARQDRLAVVDATPVDAKRRLILVRRDNVEHLILIGGPTDVVVEAAIGAAGYAASVPERSRAPEPEPARPAPRAAEPPRPIPRPAEPTVPPRLSDTVAPRAPRGPIGDRAEPPVPPRPAVPPRTAATVRAPVSAPERVGPAAAAGAAQELPATPLRPAASPRPAAPPPAAPAPAAATSAAPTPVVAPPPSPAPQPQVAPTAEHPEPMRPVAEQRSAVERPTTERSAAPVSRSAPSASAPPPPSAPPPLRASVAPRGPAAIHEQEPRVESRAEPAPAGREAQLEEMAQRLEAALKRPLASAPRPAARPDAGSAASPRPAAPERPPLERPPLERPVPPPPVPTAAAPAGTSGDTEFDLTAALAAELNLTPEAPLPRDEAEGEAQRPTDVNIYEEIIRRDR